MKENKIETDASFFREILFQLTESKEGNIVASKVIDYMNKSKVKLNPYPY